MGSSAVKLKFKKQSCQTNAVEAVAENGCCSSHGTFESVAATSRTSRIPTSV